MKRLTLVILITVLFFPIQVNASNLSDSSTTIPTHIKDFIKKQQGNISFSYQNLITKQGVVFQPKKIYRAASTIKLPMALYVFQEAVDGNIDLDEKLTYKSHHYYEGTGVIRYQEVGNTYTIRDLVKKSLVHSDNVAYIMLKERFGRENLKKYMKSIGGKYAYPGGANVTTVIDLNTYLVELYHFANQHELGKKLVEYLKNTDFNETIPKVTQSLGVAHKVGYIPYLLVFNDAAIVYDEEPYVLSIATKGLPYEQERRTIAALASLIHLYHEKSIEDRGYPFFDVQESFWAYHSIQWAFENELVRGMQNSNFNPNDSLTTKHLEAIFSRYLNRQVSFGDNKSSITRGALATIFYSLATSKDVNMEEAILWMYKQQLTNGRLKTGDPIKDYDPDKPITRAEFVVLLERYDRQF